LEEKQEIIDAKLKEHKKPIKTSIEHQKRHTGHIGQYNNNNI